MAEDHQSQPPFDGLPFGKRELMGCSKVLAGQTYSCLLINQQTFSEHLFSASQQYYAQYCGKLEKLKDMVPGLQTLGFCWGEKTNQATYDPRCTVWDSQRCESIRAQQQAGKNFLVKARQV